MTSPRPRALSVWLFAVAALVLLMVMVGGITRLTNSGLSMVRWEPVSGAIPPHGEARWQAEFDAYKAYPEYRKINRGMSLSQFKRIFFWEYLHRLLGRLIGLAFALPLLWFGARRQIPRGYGPRLVLLLALGGLQGVIGWWMVASGLVNRPDVAQERLAVHLVTALTLLAALVWTALDMRSEARPVAAPAPRPRAWIVPFLALVAVQIVFGALVAGTDAGYAFNTWPKMGDDWAPPGLASIEPVWRNFVDNRITVQFVHRCIAMLVALSAVLVGARLSRAGGRRQGAALIAMVGIQFCLGVATIVSGVDVPIAIAHQAGAALLVVVTVFAAHWAARPALDSSRKFGAP